MKEGRKRNREAKKMKLEERKIKETARLHDEQSECFNKNDLHLRMIQKYQKFQASCFEKEHAYRNTDFGGKLMAAMNNQLLYEPRETRPDWCWKQWFPQPQQMSDFITSCLWYPLYGHRNEVQTVRASHFQLSKGLSGNRHKYKYGLVWFFDLHDPCNPGSEGVFEYTWREESMGQWGLPVWPEKMPTLSKMKCEENQVISRLYLKQDFNKERTLSRWTPRATKSCSKLPHGFFFVNGTTFTFDASEFNQDRGILPWQIPCAHKHAVLVEVEFKGEAMISTCKFVSKTCD